MQLPYSLMSIVFIVGADVDDDDQELAKTSESLDEKTIRLSNEAKDENNGRNVASSATLTQSLACQKTFTAANDDDEDNDDDDDVEDSGDAGFSAAQTGLHGNAKDSAGRIDNSEEADDDYHDDDKEQVRSL